MVDLQDFWACILINLAVEHHGQNELFLGVVPKYFRLVILRRTFKDIVEMYIIPAVGNILKLIL